MRKIVNQVRQNIQILILIGPVGILCLLFTGQIIALIHKHIRAMIVKGLFHQRLQSFVIDLGIQPIEHFRPVIGIRPLKQRLRRFLRKTQ